MENTKVISYPIPLPRCTSILRVRGVAYGRKI